MYNIKYKEPPEKTNQNTDLRNTIRYIEAYLNPDRKWDNKIRPAQRINEIQYADVNWELVSDHIKGMSYQNFLKTPYWKAISAHTKYKAGYRCQLCNSVNNLVTHHRDYRIHGFEHAHMQELTVLCDDCHRKFHNLFPTRKPNNLYILLIVFAFFLTVLMYTNHNSNIDLSRRKFSSLKEYKNRSQLEVGYPGRRSNIKRIDHPGPGNNTKTSKAKRQAQSQLKNFRKKPK